MGKGYGDLLIDVLRLEHEKADLQATMDQLIESRRTWATEAMRNFEPCDNFVCQALGHAPRPVYHETLRAATKRELGQ